MPKDGAVELGGVQAGAAWGARVERRVEEERLAAPHACTHVAAAGLLCEAGPKVREVQRDGVAGRCCVTVRAPRRDQSADIVARPSKLFGAVRNEGGAT